MALKRTMRNALVAATALSAVCLGGVPASAQPTGSDSASEAEDRLRELSRRAEVLTEDFKKAQDDHAAREEELARSQAEAARAGLVAERARNEEHRFRAQVDELTAASYRGARLNTSSALFTSQSPRSFLDRASALDLLARDNNRAVQALTAATRQAESAQRQVDEARARATGAEADAARLQQEIGDRKESMEAQISEVQQQYEKLSEEERDELSGDGSDVGPIAGSGVATAAVNAALSKQGSPYVWGAKGPSEFDCSGLVQWSYEQAGLSLPTSTRSQVSEGASVSTDELKPGDVIFYYSSASHNGIYIGGDKVVHAPTEGQDVKVEDYNDIGDIHSIRRMTS